MAKKFKKALAMLLAVLMMTSTMSLPVFAEETDTTKVWDEETQTLTLNEATLSEGISVPDGATIVVNGDVTVDAGTGNAIVGAGALTIKGNGKLTVRGKIGISGTSISIEGIDVDIDVTSAAIYATNASGDSTVTLKGVDGSILGDYAGIYVYGNKVNTNASVSVDDCDLVLESHRASGHGKLTQFSGISVCTDGTKFVECSVDIKNSTVNASGLDAGIAVSNRTDGGDNYGSSRINISNSTVVAKGNNSVWSGIFASVNGTHEDADSFITIKNSSVYSASVNTGVMTSSQKGESGIYLDNSILGAGGLTALRMIEPTAQKQTAELKNGSTYVQLTPAAVNAGSIDVFEGKTIIAVEQAITYDEENNYYIIPQGSVVNETFTDGTSKEYTFQGQAGGVGGFDYDKEEIWGFDVPVTPVCKIVETGVEYETLTAAVADANKMTSATIEMLKSIDFEGTKLEIKSDITITGKYTISRGAYTDTLFTVPAGASLTLEDVTIDGNNNWTFKKAEYLAQMESTIKEPGKVYYVTNEAGAPVATATAFDVSGKVVLGDGATIQNHSGSVLFTVNSGATLETLDGSLITHNTKSGGCTVAKVEKGGTWNLQGGVITDTVGWHHGVVAEVANGAYLYMNGGDISETYGSDCNGSVFYVHGYMELNGGKIHDNWAMYSRENSNNGAIYVYYDGMFVMNGGELIDNNGSQPSGIISNANDKDKNLPTLPANIILNGGKIVDGYSYVGSKGHDLATCRAVQITNDMLIGEGRMYNDLIVDAGKTLTANDIYFHGWIVSLIGTQDYTGGGTVDADVTLYSGAEVVHHEGAWNGLVTVDAVGTGTTLTVKPGATIDGIQVRVLDSVASGEHTNTTEAAAAQAASYVEEDGANVVSPVLYYHRLTSAQKKNIVVTYDYNGGLDASGWSGSQITSAESFVPTSPEPTMEGKVLIGWAYAVENNPESLSMASNDAYNGEAIAESVRLIAQWGDATYTDEAAVVLTIDMSGTMYRYKMGSKRYVDVAKAKALDFVEQYAAAVSESGDQRLLAIASFDTDAKVVLNWVDVNTADGLAAAKKAINNMKVADNGSTSSNQVCTNFDAGVILTRNLLKQAAVSEIDNKFAIIMSDGAPTVTVNSDTDTVGTIKSSFWGNQLNAAGTKYQNKHCGGGWTHPAEVESTLKYLATGSNNLADQTTSYGENKEGIFIIGVGGDMSVKLFNDAVNGTSNGTRTTDVKKKTEAFNNVEALIGMTSKQILAMTTGEWLNLLAEKVGGTYVSASDASALQNEFNAILEYVVKS